MSISTVRMIYNQARRDGLVVVDASHRLFVTVTKTDVRRATPKSVECCPVSLALLRQRGVLKAWVFRSVAVLQYKARMVRYMIPPSVNREIVSFDRSSVFVPGKYYLQRAAPTATLDAQKAHNLVRAPKVMGVRPRKRLYTRMSGTAGIRK